MISNNIFVKYTTLDSKEDVYSFINEGVPIVSNYQNWRICIEKLIRYKEGHLKKYKVRANGKKYRNIYAHSIKTLIPYEVEKENRDQWVKNFIFTIDFRFKKLLWIYKVSTINEANYVDIVFFTRYIPKKGKKVNDTYNQDYYYDSKTGKRCEKSAENAVLKAKMGSVKLKKDGSPITKDIYVKEREERVFKFKNFQKFIQKLKNKYMRVLNRMLNRAAIYKIISRITICHDDSKSIKKAKFLRNVKINEINSMLKSFQDGIDNGKLYGSIDDIYKKFHQLICEVDEKIHKKHEETEKIKIFIKKWWIEKVVDQL